MGLKKIINDEGKTNGVYIPIEEWIIMKENYPDLERIPREIPKWQADDLDKRLQEIEDNPGEQLQIEQLFRFLEE